MILNHLEQIEAYCSTLIVFKKRENTVLDALRGNQRTPELAPNMNDMLSGIYLHGISEL